MIYEVVPYRRVAGDAHGADGLVPEHEVGSLVVDRRDRRLRRVDGSTGESEVFGDQLVGLIVPKVEVLFLKTFL